MTFNEIQLYEAVHSVYRMVENPRSDRWILYPGEREQLLRRIQAELPLDSPFTTVQMQQAWSLYGKSASKNDQGEKKTELIVVVARRFGRQCFYAGRGLGECSSEVTLDRIIPGSRGGMYVAENCMIACSAHNSQRGDKDIENYLQTSNVSICEQNQR